MIGTIQRGTLRLLLLPFLAFAIAVIVAGRPVDAASSSSSSSSAAVCSANDPREECLNDDVNNVAVGEVGDGGTNGEVDDCTDAADECRYWAESGECEANPDYMLASCRRSCNVCEHELDVNDFGKPQEIPPQLSGAVKVIISKSVDYMQNVVASDPKYYPIRSKCRNNDSRCSQWAIGSGCDDNPKYMKQECAPACRSCDYILEMEERCGLDPNGKDAIDLPGGMDPLFERMVHVSESMGYRPTVLSRPQKRTKLNPDGTYASTLSCEEDVSNPCGAMVGPWVVTLENFINDGEIEALLKWGASMGYERSQAGDQILEARTSSHAWCNEECYDDTVVKSVRNRIVHVTGIQEEHYECLQLLKYKEGQYYLPHNDFIKDHTTQVHGPRLLTFFMYFNEVPSGGGTRFPRLNGLTVEPKKGRVLIWPSVLDDEPYKEDVRTEHEALAVEEGEKYAANAWIHTRDFQASFRAGCPS